MSKQSYINGFCKQAAARGVDPNALAKYASETMDLKSTPLTDTLARLPADMILGLTPLAPAAGAINSVGTIAGLLADERKGGNENLPWTALIPGASSYRIGNRIKSQVMKEKRDIDKDEKHKGARPVAHAVSEFIGPGTSTMSMAGLGAILGAIANKQDRGLGALIGTGTGAGAALLSSAVASIAAAIKRRRTKEEQIESDKGSLLKKYLVPGVARYDYWKRLGRSQGDRDEADAEKKNKEDK